MQLLGPSWLPGQLAVAAFPGVSQYDRVVGQLTTPAKVDAADTDAWTGIDVHGQRFTHPHAGDSHGAAVGCRPVVLKLDTDQVRWWYGHIDS
jgi:hypothetical protein